MCTLVISRVPGAPWPTVIAANRDEMLDRPWDPPAAHWPTHPGSVGGRDRLAGGTWMAMAGGMVAAVLNRPGSLGPAAGFRSRGELPLAALGHATAGAAAAALDGQDGSAWRPFNLVVADAASAWLLVGDGPGPIAATALPEGVAMITAVGHDEGETARARLHLPRFRAAPHPSPATADAWAALLSATDAEPGAGPRGVLAVLPDRGYGTVSASLVFLPAGDGAPLWLFAPGPAGRARLAPVALARAGVSAQP
ncbi:NRDE family protein [Elioraea sp.]|uniref:NRDE family protein n=1 Tax=Elioraea sp. TaxID=2185103 RepID=UPI0025B8F81D|nr:NRDE family protein [Elioraea sp.]